MLEPGTRERKSERLKDFFAQTAKQMILKKGFSSISVRNIAAEAGYSLGTIYNHFSNLDELLWRTRNLFFYEIGEYMGEVKESEGSIEGLIKLFKRYANYFIEHPEVYRFFYFKTLDHESKKQPDLTDNPFFKHQRLQVFQFLMESGAYTAEELPGLFYLIIYTIHGLLTLVLGDNDNLKSSDVPGEIEKMVPLIFQRYKK